MAALPAGAAFGAADPRLGAWRLVTAQSSLTPPDILTVTALKDAVHVVITGQTHVDFTAKSDGKETAVLGNPGFDQVVMRRISKKSSEVMEKKAGALVATVAVKVSNDGQELTVTTSSPGHTDQIAVWTRSGGAKVAGDPLAGVWTEDLSKTHLRQGMVLKFQPDGDSGVRFSGDSSYTARFDGRPYPVRNSRNDTVTLALIDAHTVDAVYRRDDQISQRERWEVSADGQQLTVNSTATLETGQRLTERLVFRKQ